MAEQMIEVTVAGMTVHLCTDEEESYVLELAAAIESDIDALFNDAPGAALPTALLLCAMEYRDKYTKAKKSSTNLRAQIKEYLADTTNCKLLYEEERKRSNELAAENQKLKEMLGSADAVSSPAHDENIKRALSEIEELRQVNDTAVAQCRTLNERITALNDYIAGQDSELLHLRNVASEQTKHLNAQLQTLDECKDALAARQAEIERLEKELEVLRSNADANRPVELQQELRSSISRDFGFAHPTSYRAETGFDDTLYTDEEEYGELPDLDWTTDV